MAWRSGREARGLKNRVHPLVTTNSHGQVVVAYPQDRREIERAWAMLNDANEVLLPEMNFPGGTPSQVSDYVMASQSAKVLSAARCLIRFRDHANPGWNSPPPSGYYVRQLLIQGVMVCQERQKTSPSGCECASKRNATANVTRS